MYKKNLIKNNTNKLLIIAGGTGGHVIPGILIAHCLIKKGWSVNWLGTRERIESSLVPKHGINIEFVRINYFNPKNWKEKISSLITTFSSLLEIRKFIRLYKPNVALGMGGYISGLGMLAAWSCGIPIVLHEQNRIAGLSNKMLSYISYKTLQAFPNVLPHAKVVGNPLRNSILNILPPEKRFLNRDGLIRVLVTGGSQGAKILNQVMPEVFRILKDKIVILHQSGSKDYYNVIKKYNSIQKTGFKVIEFIDDISEVYNWADIVICRSGAITVSEIAEIGLFALFVPFEHKDKQQYLNALPLEKIGLAKIIKQKKFTVDKVSETLSNLDRKTLLEIAKRTRSITRKDSSDLISQEIESIISY